MNPPERKYARRALRWLKRLHKRGPRVLPPGVIAVPNSFAAFVAGLAFRPVLDAIAKSFSSGGAREP